MGDRYAKWWPTGTTRSPASDAAIAAALGVSDQTVGRERRRRGIEPYGEPGGGVRRVEEDRARVVAVEVPESEAPEVRARLASAARQAGARGVAPWALEVLLREAAKLERRAARAGGEG